MLECDPAKRMTVTDALNHSYFSSEYEKFGMILGHFLLAFSALYHPTRAVRHDLNASRHNADWMLLVLGIRKCIPKSRRQAQADPPGEPAQGHAEGGEQGVWCRTPPHPLPLPMSLIGLQSINPKSHPSSGGHLWQ